MNTASILKNLVMVVSGPTSEIRYKSMTKDSMILRLEDDKMCLNGVLSTIKTIGVASLDKAYAQSNLKIKPKSSDNDTFAKYADSFMRLTASLDGRARTKGLAGTILYTNTTLLSMNYEITKNIDKLMLDKNKIVIEDIPLSFGLFIGILEASRMFSKFTSFLLASMSHILSGSPADIPRYMLTYMADNQEMYSRLLNSVFNNVGRFSVVNDVTKLRSHGLDFKLSAADSIAPSMFFSIFGLENVFLAIFNIMIKPFALIGETYIDARHEYYEAMKERNNWIAAHAAVLQLELEGTDKNDPKYIKMKKVVAYYEDEMAKMEKKLASYSGEE